MKLISLITTTVIAVFTLNYSLSQQSELWGTTTLGGSNDGGTIYSTDGFGQNFSTEFSFEKLNIINPMGGFVEANDGYYYALSQNGGTELSGTIFRMDPSTESIEVVYSFSSSGPNFPIGNLKLVSNGNLIGVTQGGGANSDGVLFEFDYSTNTMTVLHDFLETSGNSPKESIIETSNGMYYGLTSAGGANDVGVIYSYDNSTQTYTVEHEFESSMGANPIRGLMQASNGNIYGLTHNGGTGNFGTLFEFNPLNSNYSVLHSFDNTNGSYPSSTILQITNGKLIGTTRQGGASDYGVLFEYDLSTGFNALQDLSRRHGGKLTETDPNVIWGVQIDGYADYGNYFSYDFNTSQFSTQGNFSEFDGLVISSLLSSNGQYFYALTSNGGLTDEGKVIKYDYVNDINQDIVDFSFAPLGEGPESQLLHLSNHLFYGTTISGGVNNRGVIYSYDAQSQVYQKLVDFEGPNGAVPKGNLLLADDGLIYGTTSEGGSNDMGVLYSFNPMNSNYTVIHEFDGTSGEKPVGSLIQASDNHIYGVCNQGGSFNFGVIFKLDINANSLSVIYEFENTLTETGIYPESGLTEGSGNKLYGTTYYYVDGAGNNYGALYSFDITTMIAERLHVFNQIEVNPEFGVTFHDDGMLYGLTNAGGDNNVGVIYSYDTLAESFMVNHHFEYVPGTAIYNPTGKLIETINEVTIGLSHFGGNSGIGVIYEFDKQSGIVSATHEFENSVTGRVPRVEPTEVIICLPNTGTDIIEACDSYTWIDGNTYNSNNNTATYTLMNVSGCDSVVTLDLTINNSSQGTDVQTACYSYTWIDGNTYTSSNNSATHILTNQNGCDSIVTLDLTIDEVSDITTSINGLTITANNQNSTYQWLDCDNGFSVINNEINASFTVTQNGEYAVELTENGCVDTSGCVVISDVGLAQNNDKLGIKIYPNPTVNIIYIEGIISDSYSIVDMNGSIVLKGEVSNYAVNVSTLKEGTYFININTENNVFRRRFVKM